MFLSDLQQRQSGRIIGYRGRMATTQRLLAMGMLPGRSVQVVQVAPFGDPFTIQMDGARVSLRRDEASALRVEPA